MVFRRSWGTVSVFVLICTISVVGTSAYQNSGSPTPAGTNLPLAAVSGPQSTLVILVRFPDKNNSTSPSTIQGLLRGLNNYYGEDSYGTVSFQATVSPTANLQWYTLPQTMEYYSGNTPSVDNQLVTDSLQAAYNAGVDISNYKYAIVVHSGNDAAMPPHLSTDIHSFTLPGYRFNPAPLVSYTISTSVVSESDPVGVFCHEAGHLLGLPDLYDLTGQIDPVNNFVGYWEIMALGEWNPNNGNLAQPSPGTYPSHHSSWSKIQLGFVPPARVFWANSTGGSYNVTVQNLELPTSGTQIVKIPIVNFGGNPAYYLIEMRAKLGIYDQYLPFPSTYPGAGLLIYKVNESIANGHGSVVLVNAHPGSDLSNAPFGPCLSPCASNNTFWDRTNFVKVIVTTTSPTAYSITVDRTSAPPFLLQVNTPSPGVLVSIDGSNMPSDNTRQVRVTVRYGPHTVFVQPQIPVSLGPTSIQVGLTNSFAAWDDGTTANPRSVPVVKDTVLTATYRIMIEPSLATATTAVIILGVVTTALALNRRRHQRKVQDTLQTPPPPLPPVNVPSGATLLPGDHGLPGDTIKGDQEPPQA